MDILWNLGIAIVLWLQGLGLWLLGPMKVFTNLGYEQFYILAAPLLFWSVDPALGLRVGVAVMLGNAVNSILKLAFHGPRPYWYDQRVLPLGREPSFGAPSSHAQNAVVFWYLTARGLRLTWMGVLAVLMILLISLSRLYLGAHFPSDVLIGWLAGMLIVWLTIRFERPILEWLRRKPVGAQVGAVLAVSLVMIAVVAVVRAALSGWRIPETWLTLAGRIGSIDPFALSGTISASASFFGLASGAILLARLGWFNPGGRFWQHLARYMLGLAGVIAIWYGLDQVFPSGEDFVSFAFRFIRYGLVGLWVTFLAPLLFFRLKLAVPKYPRFDAADE